MSLNVGTLSAILDLDTNPFERKLLGTSTTAERAGGRMESVGNTMTKGITLPLIAAGGAAAKLGMDFDTTFARMVGLAGVPKAEIEGLKDSVLDLAGETAQAPQELADALYDAASAGLDSAQAMDAVSIAAHGAAAGLGSTGDIVGLVASATASYGAANIDASKAVDILTATIRAGRADPAELAGTLGRILPVASQLGVSFDEVGGATAFLSNVFGDTNRTVTALSGFLIKLVSPSQQGRQALDDMGTSVEELQAAIDQDGLMGALNLLREHGFADNQTALRGLFDDIEGFQGALALLNDESGTLNSTLAETKDSTGALGEAFDAAHTDGQDMRQSLADLQVAAIKAGDTIAPFVATVARGIGSVAEAFASLPGPAQQVVLAFAAILAATGPILSIGGKLISNWKSIASGVSTVTRALGGMGSALGVLGLAAAAGAAAYFGQKLSDMAPKMDRAMESTQGFTEAMDDNALAALALAAENGKLDDVVRDVASTNVLAAERMLDQAEAAGITGDKIDELRAIIDDKRGTDKQAATDQAAYNDQVAAGVGPTEDLAGATDTATTALQEYADALAAQLDPLFGMMDANRDLADAQKAVNDAIAANSDANADNNVTQDEMIRLNDAAVRAAEGYQTSLLKLKDAVDSGSVSIEDAMGTMQLWADQGLITQTQADEAAWSFGVLGGKADELDGKNVLITATADTWDAAARIQALKDSIASVPRTVPVNFIGPLLPNQRRAKDPDARAGGGPVWAGEDFLVGEEGPELVRFSGAGHVFDADTTRQMLSGGGSTAPAMPAAAPTIVDQSQHTFAPQITTGLDPAETFAALDRYTRMRYGRSLASVVGA